MQRVDLSRDQQALAMHGGRRFGKVRLLGKPIINFSSTTSLGPLSPGHNRCLSLELFKGS